MEFNKSIENRLSKMPIWMREYATYKWSLGCKESTILEYLHIIDRFLSYINPNVKVVSTNMVSYEKKDEYIQSLDITDEMKYRKAASTEHLLDDFLDFLCSKYELSVDNHFSYDSILPSLEEAREMFVDKTSPKRRKPSVDTSWAFEERDFERIFFPAANKGGSLGDMTKRRVIFALLMSTGMDLKTLCNLSVKNYNPKKKCIQIHNDIITRELLLNNYVTKIIDNHLRYNQIEEGLIISKKNENQYYPNEIEALIQKRSNSIWWRKLDSKHLRCPMYALLVEKKGKAFAQMALEYVCLYNGHTDLEKSGQLEYEYGVHVINNYLKDLDVDSHLIKFATITLSAEELMDIYENCTDEENASSDDIIKGEISEEKYIQTEVDNKIASIKGSLERLSNRIQNIQMMNNYLDIANTAAKTLDYQGYIEALGNAVDHGYKGDYHFIGIGLLTGILGIQKDFDKGYYWLKRFFDEYRAGNLDELEEPSEMVEVCYNLGTAAAVNYFNTHDEMPAESDINKVLEYYKTAIEYGDYLSKDEHTLINELYTISRILYHGTFSCEDKNVYFAPDYKCAFEGLKKLERFNNVDVLGYLASMYEDGKYVAKSIDKARKYYIKAADLDDEDAIEWCEDHFINSLNWDIRPDWKDISVKDAMNTQLPLIGDDEVIETLYSVGIYSLEDFRLGGIRTLAKNHSLERVILGSFLVNGIEETISSYSNASDDNDDGIDFELPFN